MAVIKSVRKTCGETRWRKNGFRPSSVICFTAQGRKRQMLKAHSLKMRIRNKSSKYNNPSSLNPAECFPHRRLPINVELNLHAQICSRTESE